jgi:hypothetical protein
MKKERLSVLLAVAAMLVVMLALPGTAQALPAERPDDTPEVDGRVRAIEQVGTNVWVGGKFSKVTQPDGSVFNVSNVAVFNSATDQYVPIAPKLGDTSSEVWDMALYGNNVLIAGKFPGPTSTKKNLVLVDGTTGEVIRWYNNSPSLRSVLAAPLLGRVYGGGVSLSAFDALGGKKLWTRAKATVDKSLRAHDTRPAYHDLVLDGSTIWAACACDAVAAPDGTLRPAKALVKLTTEGVHDASWLAEAGKAAFGHSVVNANGRLYLGAGGSDFLAEFSKESGNRTWVRDTSGSTQGVEVMEGQLVIGGHFWEVADRGGDKCGSGRDYSDRLDPNNECQTRKGIAAYSFDGVLDPNWDPVYSGSYHLVWALHVEGTRLHTGGQFKRVSGVPQNSYARLS